MTREPRLLHGALLVAAIAAAAQIPGLAGPLLWDDLFLVRPNGLYTSAAHLREALSAPLGNMTYYWRPLATTSLLLDSLLHGTGDAWGYRLTNLLLHAAASAGACVLLARLLSSRIAAVLAALAWALHPVNVETVTWISARFDLLAGLFGLAALLAATSRTEKPAALAACGLATLAACLSKESAFVLPVVLALFVAAVRCRDAAAQARPVFARRMFAASAAALGGVVLLRLAVLGYVLRTRPEAAEDAGRGLRHLLLMGRALATYLTTIVFPWGTVGPAHVGERPIPAGDALGWTGVALGAALLASTIVALRRRRRTGLLLAAFVVSLAPVAQIVPLDIAGGLHAADRFLYLPAFLAVAAISDLAAGLVPATRMRTAGAAGATIVFALAAGRLAILPRWGDRVRFWAWATEMAPSSGVARGNLAYVLLAQGRIPEAEAEARKMPQGDANVLADVLEAQGRAGEAVDVLTGILRVRPRNAAALLHRGDLFCGLGRVQAALGDYAAVVRLESERRSGFEPLRERAAAGAAAALALVDPAAAAAQADRAETAAPPDDAPTWLHLAHARLTLRDAAGAARAIERAAASGADANAVAGLRAGLEALAPRR